MSPRSLAGWFLCAIIVQFHHSPLLEVAECWREVGDSTPEVGALSSVEFLICVGEFLAVEFTVGFIGELLLWFSSATWPSSFLPLALSASGWSEALLETLTTAVSSIFRPSQAFAV